MLVNHQAKDSEEFTETRSEKFKVKHNKTFRNQIGAEPSYRVTEAFNHAVNHQKGSKFEVQHSHIDGRYIKQKV